MARGVSVFVISASEDEDMVEREEQDVIFISSSCEPCVVLASEDEEEVQELAINADSDVIQDTFEHNVAHMGQDTYISSLPQDAPENDMAAIMLLLAQQPPAFKSTLLPLEDMSTLSAARGPSSPGW